MQTDRKLWKNPHDGFVETFESGKMDGNFAVEQRLAYRNGILYTSSPILRANEPLYLTIFIDPSCDHYPLQFPCSRLMLQLAQVVAKLALLTVFDSFHGY